MVGIVQHGVVYTGKTSKIAEHGGDDPQDRNVPLLVVGPGAAAGRATVTPVETTQIAPDHPARRCGLDPNALQAVRAGAHRSPRREPGLSTAGLSGVAGCRKPAPSDSIRARPGSGEALVSEPTRASPRGVSDGARTRDTQDHNLVLYQLSYTHHVAARRATRRRDTAQRYRRRVSPPTRPGSAVACRAGVAGRPAAAANDADDLVGRALRLVAVRARARARTGCAGSRPARGPTR